MACWECLLSPQCVFTEPNSFLGRNGASLRNMCTTHLLLLLPRRHTHTHAYASPPPNNKSNLWNLGFGGGVSSRAARWHEGGSNTRVWTSLSCVCSGWIGVRVKKKKKKGSRCYGGWFLQINTSCPESCWREICECLRLKRNQTREETSEVVQLKVTCKCICTWLKSWWEICQ